MIEKLQYLLLQVRKPDDLMKPQEVTCFTRVLGCRPEQLRPMDLLAGAPTRKQLGEVDVVLLGGSGHFGAIDDTPWLDRALDVLRQIHDLGKPTFASCWGFQAMSRALGGTVVKDRDRAELGTHRLQLTADGRADPVFGPLGDSFHGQMGHEDSVVELPRGAVLLASTVRVTNQAFRFAGKPIYCTQFHSELNRAALLERVRTYPEYVECISGMTLQEFDDCCRDTPEAEALLPCFVRHVFGD